MSTLRIRAVHMPQLPIRSVTRMVAIVALLFDTFAEAQKRARAAHNRYPFAEW